MSTKAKVVVKDTINGNLKVSITFKSHEQAKGFFQLVDRTNETEIEAALDVSEKAAQEFNDVVLFPIHEALTEALTDRGIELE